PFICISPCTPPRSPPPFPTRRSSDLALHGITLDQLADRRRLMSAFDGLRRELDASGTVTGIDANVDRAFGVLTSSKLLQALDQLDRKSTRLNSSHQIISYAVFCLKKK